MMVKKKCTKKNLPAKNVRNQIQLSGKAIQYNIIISLICKYSQGTEGTSFHTNVASVTATVLRGEYFSEIIDTGFTFILFRVSF